MMLKVLTLVVIVSLMFTKSATADIININMAGWSNEGNFEVPGNSEFRANIGAGSIITAVEFIDLQFTALGGSWISDMALSVNNTDGSVYWDWRPGNDLLLATKNGPGTYGPRSGSFGLLAGITANGSLVGGSSPGNVLLANGDLFVTVYDPFPKDNVPGLEATITSGTLRVTFTAVPEPSSMLLLGCAMFSGSMALSRRKSFRKVVKK